MARPTKLTPALQKRIIKLIADGCYASQAAAACGIAESTYYNWIRDGRNAEAKQQEGGHRLTAKERSLLDFLVSVRTAEAKAEADAIKVIQTAAHKGDFRAAQWFLERKHGTRWARRDVHQVETTIKEAEQNPRKTHDELLEELQRLENEG